MQFIIRSDQNILVLNNQEINLMELKFNLTVLAHKHHNIGDRLYGCFMTGQNDEIHVNGELFLLLKELSEYSYEEVKRLTRGY